MESHEWHTVSECMLWEIVASYSYSLSGLYMELNLGLLFIVVKALNFHPPLVSELSSCGWYDQSLHRNDNDANVESAHTTVPICSSFPKLASEHRYYGGQYFVNSAEWLYHLIFPTPVERITNAPISLCELRNMKCKRMYIRRNVLGLIYPKELSHPVLYIRL